MNVAYLSMHPAPYENAFLNLIVRDTSVKTDIFFLFPNDLFHMYWNLDATKYKAQILSEWSTHWLRLLLVLLHKVVFSRKYDLVLWPGYANKATIVAEFISALFGRRYGLKADSIRQEKRSAIVLWIKRFIIKRADIIFVPGAAGQKFFSKYYGVPSNRIILGAYSLDGLKIEQQIQSRKKQKLEIRRRFDIADSSIVFLMVANMHRNRHYPITSEAFIRFAEKCPNALFVMVGNGCDFELMRRKEEEHSCLKVLPGCSFEEMLDLYAVADIYVHGGEEPASTALVLGAIAHLPLISSDAVGCSADVLVESETGCKVKDNMSVDDWFNAFCRIYKDKDKWKIMGDNARVLSRQLDADVVAQKFLNSFESLNRVDTSESR